MVRHAGVRAFFAALVLAMLAACSGPPPQEHPWPLAESLASYAGDPESLSVLLAAADWAFGDDYELVDSRAYPAVSEYDRDLVRARHEELAQSWEHAYGEADDETVTGWSKGEQRMVLANLVVGDEQAVVVFTTQRHG